MTCPADDTPMLRIVAFKLSPARTAARLPVPGAVVPRSALRRSPDARSQPFSAAFSALAASRTARSPSTGRLSRSRRNKIANSGPFKPPVRVANQNAPGTLTAEAALIPCRCPAPLPRVFVPCRCPARYHECLFPGASPGRALDAIGTKVRLAPARSHADADSCH